MMRRLGEFLCALVACMLFDWEVDGSQRPGAARRDAKARSGGERRGDIDPGAEPQLRQAQSGGLVWGPGLESRFRRRQGETSGGDGNSRNGAKRVAQATLSDNACGAG